MMGGIAKTRQYQIILGRDKKYDGIFYFAAKSTGQYCRPSCPAAHQLQKDYCFFDNVQEARLHGYRACKRCHPDRLQNNLSVKILGSIDAGAINDQGVHGLADSLHISERHLRRLVQNRTGESPIHLNRAKRLIAAKRLVVQTKLPIIDIAFIAEFSSLRQFNDVFKNAFKISPRGMRKTALLAPKKKLAVSSILPLRFSYAALMRARFRPSIN